MQLVIRIGDTIDVDHGPGTDLRTVTQLTLEQTARTAGDTLMGTAQFSDGGQAIFLTPIPEPVGIVAAAVAAALLIRGSRRLSGR